MLKKIQFITNQQYRMQGSPVYISDQGERAVFTRKISYDGFISSTNFRFSQAISETMPQT